MSEALCPSSPSCVLPVSMPQQWVALNFLAQCIKVDSKSGGDSSDSDSDESDSESSSGSDSDDEDSESEEKEDKELIETGVQTEKVAHITFPDKRQMGNELQIADVSQKADYIGGGGGGGG